MKSFDARKGRKLPKSIVGDLRFFAYYIGNQTLLLPHETDISLLYEKSSALGDLFRVELFNRYDYKGTVQMPSKNKSNLSKHDYVKALNKGNVAKLNFPVSLKVVKKDQNWRSAIVRFMLGFGQRVLDTEPLADWEEDYAEDVLDYGNSMEMLTAIYCNVLRMDKNYNVINESWARHRASQYIRLCVDESYKSKPPLKEWETTLWI